MAANKKIDARIPAIIHAYLQDLAEIGYGKDKSAVARRFIENAVLEAVEKGVIKKRTASKIEGSDVDY